MFREYNEMEEDIKNCETFVKKLYKYSHYINIVDISRETYETNGIEQ